MARILLSAGRAHRQRCGDRGHAARVLRASGCGGARHRSGRIGVGGALGRGEQLGGAAGPAPRAHRARALLGGDGWCDAVLRPRDESIPGRPRVRFRGHGRAGGARRSCREIPAGMARREAWPHHRSSAAAERVGSRGSAAERAEHAAGRVAVRAPRVPDAPFPRAERAPVARHGFRCDRVVVRVRVRCGQPFRARERELAAARRDPGARDRRAVRTLRAAAAMAVRRDRNRRILPGSQQRHAGRLLLLPGDAARLPADRRAAGR